MGRDMISSLVRVKSCERSWIRSRVDEIVEDLESCEVACTAVYGEECVRGFLT